MRRIVFVVLIIVVAAVIGLYAFLEFRVGDIVFVRDFSTATNLSQTEAAVRRLYSSAIDVDAFFEEVEQKLVSVDFDEDDIFRAALASGTPEFYPAFYFTAQNLFGTDDYNFYASVKQEAVPDQTTFNYKISNLYLEIMTDGLIISDEIKLIAENEEIDVPGTPILSADGRTLAIDLSNVAAYELKLSGTGSITFQYTYDITSSALLTKTVLEEQLLIVHFNLSADRDAEFILEPYSSLEEYFE